MNQKIWCDFEVIFFVHTTWCDQVIFWYEPSPIFWIFSDLTTKGLTFQLRGLGWRTHCGVEVTELSTNKQHTLFLQEQI